MPWAEFVALIGPHYPKVGNGRPPVGLERMLRMYCRANSFNLSDIACEDALYDVPVFREFCRIDLGRERAPDATTLMNFRHLLEAHDLGAALFAKVGELLLANSMRLLGGTIVDVTLIAAPPSTKNKDKSRDPEMHQTKKVNDWHLGMRYANIFSKHDFRYIPLGIVNAYHPLVLIATLVVWLPVDLSN